MSKYNTDPEFISEIARELDVSVDAAKDMVDGFTKCIKKVLVMNGVLNIRQLGFFQTKTRKGGRARNIRTGQEMTIPVMMRLLFKPSYSLKQAINERAKKVRKEKVGF